MVIRSQTIRLGIFISTFILAAIIIFQLVWLKKVYDSEQKQFNHIISHVIRGFYEDINDPDAQSNNLNQRITTYNDMTFFAQLNHPLKPDSISAYVREELEEENIFTDCYVALYSAQQQAYIFTDYLPYASEHNRRAIVLPPTHEKFDHLTLYFPHREQYILSEMNFWIITSLVLLVVLILLSGSLYYFYRQKFLNETQKDFVNNFTHEFKTPLSVINLAVDVLANPSITQKPDKLARYVSIIQYQGMHLQEQIEKLLQHAYSENHALRLDKEKLDLHEVINEALENLNTLIAARGAVVEHSFMAAPSFVLADKGYLLIVVTNLVENALKYSEQPKIVISTWSDDTFVSLSVKDNGKGIEKRFRNKIFKKFYRIPTGEESITRGFGLGLAFVKKIIDAHKGKIHVESVPGIGSEFRISLPLN